MFPWVFFTLGTWWLWIWCLPCRPRQVALIYHHGICSSLVVDTLYTLGQSVCVCVCASGGLFFFSFCFVIHRPGATLTDRLQSFCLVFSPVGGFSLLGYLVWLDSVTHITAVVSSLLKFLLSDTFRLFIGVSPLVVGWVLVSVIAALDAHGTHTGKMGF